MPTGYTAAVQSGKITEFKDFALTCARAFGALIEMRDSPADATIPDEIKPSTYYAEVLATAEAELAALDAMTTLEVHEAAAKEHADAVANLRRYETERAAQRARYEAMLEKVKAWTPPTDDHVEMKDFMVQQLRQSIDHDCGWPASSAPAPLSAGAWLNQRRARLVESITRYRLQDAAERERAEMKTAWLRALKASLHAQES